MHVLIFPACLCSWESTKQGQLHANLCECLDPAPPVGFASSPTWAQFPAALAQITAAALPTPTVEVDGGGLFSLLIKWIRLKGEHGFLCQRVEPKHQGRVCYSAEWGGDTVSSSFSSSFSDQKKQFHLITQKHKELRIITMSLQCIPLLQGN